MSETASRICVSVLHEVRDIFRRRFHLVGNRERTYAVWTERGLGFRICSDEDVLVRVQPASPVGWLIWELPWRLEVFLAGEHRGFIRRPRLGPFRRDVLTLDGRQYPLPHQMEHDTGELGMELSWGMFGARPSICIPREEDLPVGLLVLAYVYVRTMVVY